jgi:hypothetical protein
MKHKLSRLDEYQLKKLRGEILIHKIKKHDDYNDIMPVLPKPMGGAGSPMLRHRIVDKREST